MMKPDRFTEQAQEVLAASQELVRKLRHSQWDVEHILLALLNQKEGLTDEILRQLGVDPALVKQRVEKVLDESPKMAYENPQVYATPRIMQLLQNATAEADRLTDGHGRNVDFKNTVIIMTSNLGSAEFQRSSIGFRKSDETKADRQRKKGAVETALKQTFRPEFLNRIDDIVVFDELTEEQLHQIVELMLKEMQERLDERKITASLTPEAKSWLTKEGFDPLFGARPLRRTIQRSVENSLSKKILEGEFQEGDSIVIDREEDALVFTKQ